MATTSTPTPAIQPPDSIPDPEPWDHLFRHRNRQAACLSEAQKIQDVCPRDPGHTKSPVTDCRVCYRKIVDCIAHRYLDAPESEWYADRRTFLQHLAELFPAVKRGEVDASGIEDRVADEKRKWHRENVRRIAGVMAAVGMGAARDELLDMVEDRKMEFGAFCERVTGVIDGVVKVPCPPGSLERLEGTRDDVAARTEVCKDVFFFPGGWPAEVDESTRRYLDMLDQGMSMSKVAGNMVEDRKRVIADRAEIERLESRIQYLKKAKETWLAQRRSRDADAEGKVPPCVACGKQPDVRDPLSCPICQVGVAHEIVGKAVVYCSEGCQSRAHDQHVGEAHKCAGGEHCVTMHHVDQHDADEDNDPSNAPGDCYFCKECLELHKTISIFCCRECAFANYSYHRDRWHSATARSRSVGPDPGRLHDSGTRSQTHGRAEPNVQSKLITLQRALLELQEAGIFDQLRIMTSLPEVPPTRMDTVSDRKSPGPPPTEINDVKTGDVQSKAEVHAVVTPADHMDMDMEAGKDVKRAPTSPGLAISKLEEGEISEDDRMEDADIDGLSERDADTDMLDAVGVADSAAAPQPGVSEPAPVASEAEMDGAADIDPKSSLPTEAAAKRQLHPEETQPAKQTSAESKPLQPAPTGPKPWETVPVSLHHDHLAQPTVSVSEATSTTPQTITSIQPMPTLGKSLEVEITQLPPGGGTSAHSKPASDSGSPPTEATLAHDRFLNVEAMDRIAADKAQEVGSSVIPPSAADGALGGEGGRGERDLVGVRKGAHMGPSKPEGDDLAAEAIRRGKEEADKGQDGEGLKKGREQIAAALREVNSVVENLNRGEWKGGEEVGLKAVRDEEEVDAKEDGEISSSDDSSRKRKAEEEKPGEVVRQEDGAREAKKVRSVDGGDGAERSAATD